MTTLIWVTSVTRQREDFTKTFCDYIPTSADALNYKFRFNQFQVKSKSTIMFLASSCDSSFILILQNINLKLKTLKRLTSFILLYESITSTDKLPRLLSNLSLFFSFFPLFGLSANIRH